MLTFFNYIAIEAENFLLLPFKAKKRNNNNIVLMPLKCKIVLVPSKYAFLFAILDFSLFLLEYLKANHSFYD